MALTDKQLQILEKAETLISEKGFDGTTVRDIADAAGVNLAMISYYFGSKEKLLESLFKERMSATRARMEGLINDPSFTVIQKINIMVDEYINKVIQKQHFYKIMLCEQVFNKNTEVIKLLKSYKFAYATLISGLIEEGQKQKKFKKDIDVVMLLTTMTGTVTQMLINKDYYREFNGHKKLSEAAYNELLRNKLSMHVKKIFKAILGYEE